MNGPRYIDTTCLPSFTVRELNEIITDGSLYLVGRNANVIRIGTARSVKGQLQVQSLNTGVWIDA